MPPLSRRLILAALLAVPASALAQDARLGLAERRAIAAYQQDTWPATQAGIQQAAGFDVPIEVQWERIAIPGAAANYQNPQYWGATIFEPLTAALRDVTKDAMGREALRGALKRIVVTYDRATAPASNYPNGLTFADGTLTINWTPFSNVGDVAPRTKAIVTLLEKNL